MPPAAMRKVISQTEPPAARRRRPSSNEIMKINEQMPGSSNTIPIRTSNADQAAAETGAAAAATREAATRQARSWRRARARHAARPRAPPCAPHRSARCRPPRSKKQMIHRPAIACNDTDRRSATSEAIPIMKTSEHTPGQQQDDADHDHGDLPAGIARLQRRRRIRIAHANASAFMAARILSIAPLR